MLPEQQLRDRTAARQPRKMGIGWHHANVVARAVTKERTIMGAFEQALQTFIATLQGFAVPFGVIGLISAILAFLITPLLGDALGNNRGYVQRALLGIAFIGFIPGIVAALYAMGGGGG
jgi:hypothetical protein